MRPCGGDVKLLRHDVPTQRLVESNRRHARVSPHLPDRSVTSQFCLGEAQQFPTDAFAAKRIIRCHAAELPGWFCFELIAMKCGASDCQMPVENPKMPAAGQFIPGEYGRFLGQALPQHAVAQVHQFLQFRRSNDQRRVSVDNKLTNWLGIVHAMEIIKAVGGRKLALVGPTQLNRRHLLLARGES